MLRLEERAMSPRSGLGVLLVKRRSLTVINFMFLEQLTAMVSTMRVNGPLIFVRLPASH